jgi:metal-sulfur cluster biosynthetic enzyme
VCVLQKCAATLITLNDNLMSIGGVYYVNIQQHWSPWMTSWCLMEMCTTSMSSNNDHLEWDLDVYWRCVLRQCAATLITLNDILMSIEGVYCVNVQQHKSPWMTSWCLLEVYTTSMCSNSDHLEWYLDVYWRCVLRQCAATLITLNENLMSIGGVYYVNVQQHWSPLNDILMSNGGLYYVNVQQHWSPWMTYWCLMEVCTTSMCSNIDHLNWHLDVYWWVCTTSMSSNIDHLEWHIDVYWRCVLRQCAVTLITLNDTLMSIGGVYYVNVQQHWSPWMRPWFLLEVCTTSMCSNTDHLEWHLNVYWRCVLHQCAATLITLNETLMSIRGVYYINVQQH